MKHLEIIIPFGLPSPAIAPDLAQALNTPALSTLLAKAGKPISTEFDPFARSLPHETWLSSRLDTAKTHNTDSSPALANRYMHNLGQAQDEGFWFILHPSHIHVARDHMMLTDIRQCRLTEAESRALFATAQPLFEERGKTLLYGNAKTWFVRADDWRHLQTSTPDATAGHNIDVWMPKGDGEREWRQLQNEVQMEWYGNSINTEREKQRLTAINSLWLWGGTDARRQENHLPYTCSMTTPIETGMQPQNSKAASIESVLSAPDLLVLDELSEAALSEEWGIWLEHMHALEKKWFAPLLQALKIGQLTQIKLIVGHNEQLREFTVNKTGLYKFWAKPSLARLLP